MKIFLLSSSIIENTLISNLDYLINRNITEILMLQENHTENEFLKYSKHKIVLCNTIKDAITLCDSAIIISPPNIQSDKYKLIYEYVKINVQETYYLDISYLQCTEISKNILYPPDIPTILVLAIGRFHQVQTLELSLNELFTKKKVNFTQLFSPTTTMVINNLKERNLLNQSIENSLYPSRFDVRLMTCCFESFEVAFNNLALLETVQKILPSYVFLVGEKNLLHNEKWLNSFMNRLNCTFDSILYADYISILWDEVFVPIRITNNFNLYLKNEDSEAIWNDITKRIVFPENIKVIRANR